MLYKTEWLSPHDNPAGGSLAQWVETVRQFEESGWLGDPRSHPVPPGRRAITLVQSTICKRLCWRQRCHRAHRCKHRIALAVREFMPELSVVIAGMTHDAPLYSGPLNAGKIEVLREILGPPYDAAEMGV